MAENTIKVRGLRELQRDFRKMGGAVNAELKAGLREVAEVVRSDAQSRASSSIRNIGPRWERMRTGVTTRVVYVAPLARNRGGPPRANLAGLLMDRALQPALDANEGEVVARVDMVLGRLGGENGF